MANIRSQIKRIRTNEKARQRNRAAKSEVKTRIKVAIYAAEVGDEAAAEHLRLAVKVLDKAAARGIIHRNQAANRKSGLMLRLELVTATTKHPTLEEFTDLKSLRRDPQDQRAGTYPLQGVPSLKTSEAIEVAFRRTAHQLFPSIDPSKPIEQPAPRSENERRRIFAEIAAGRNQHQRGKDTD